VLGLLVAAGAVEAPAGAVEAPATVVVRYRAPTASPVRVVRPFVGPAQPWAAGHRGVDLALAAGSTVLAPASGTVVVAGMVVDRGVVTIQHADGRRSSLEPVAASVVVGAEVAAGEPLGTLSQARHHCAGSCLHWGVRQGLAYLDPVTLLPGGGPVVLLPGG
jgi:murein DD-endopeptidase MepM/ murein hydrolase activator NlpD